MATNGVRSSGRPGGYQRLMSGPLHSVIGIEYMIANFSVLLASFTLKFFVYKGFVFAHRSGRLGKAQETTGQGHLTKFALKEAIGKEAVHVR